MSAIEVFAQKQLDHVTKQFESQFHVYPVDGNHLLSATGEEYIEVVAGQIGRAEGQSIPAWPTAAEAVKAFEQSLAHFNGATGILYWRKRPEIERHEGQWKVYSRFLISDKPDKYPARMKDLLPWDTPTESTASTTSPASEPTD